MIYQSSVHTDYSHKEASTLERMPSFSHSKPSNSRVENYLQKLQTLCKEHTKKIKANKPIIEQLECQRRFFKRICEKQKQKIDGVNLALVREEYEAQINSLREKRTQMHQMIQNIHQEAEEKKESFLETEKNLKENQAFLEQSLQQLYVQNSRYRELLQKKLETVMNQKKQILANQQLIRDKEKIEEKYGMVCQQIQDRQNAASKNFRR